MTNSYLNIIELLPQIHRRFMDVIKKDLEGLRIQDINNVQSIMLFNIGDTALSVGELTLRGVDMPRIGFCAVRFDQGTHQRAPETSSIGPSVLLTTPLPPSCLGTAARND